MKENLWFTHLLKDIDLSATLYITKNFPKSRFVNISQKETKNYVTREIAFIFGPYTLCRATNKVRINSIVKKWLENDPHIPFGKKFKNLKLSRVLTDKTNNSRKYKISGKIEAEIEETFFPIREVSISAYCGIVKNGVEDLEVSKKFQNQAKSDFYLFPETYPFSRNQVTHSDFIDGAIYSGYTKSGPEVFLKKNGSSIQIIKNTPFADEKKTLRKNGVPIIQNHNGIKVAVLVCYDLLNPKISYSLSKQNPDIVLVPAMIPKADINKWKHFIYTRGQEIQTPIILASNEDKRKICSAAILFYNNIDNSIKQYSRPTKIKTLLNQNKLTKSPQVHWSWLLKNKVFGPFIEDFN